MSLRFIIILLLCYTFSVSAQTQITSYKLFNEVDHVNKISSQNPTSNTITDIVTIGDTIWLGTSRGVSVSFDNGANWTNFYGRSDFGTDNISSIGYDEVNRTFWCATAVTVQENGQSLPKGTGLKYTTDFGSSWNSIPQPLDHKDSSTVRYGNNNLSALPVTVAIQNLVYDIAFTPGAIWISTFAGGLRKAKIDSLIANQNYRWQRVVLPPDNINFITPDSTYSFCLSPVAGSFCSTGNLNHRVFSVISSDDSTVWVGTAGGVNKSTDGGISWNKFSAQNQQNGISGNFITALGYNPTGSTLWASTWKAESPEEFYAVSYTSDGGTTWKTALRDERPHNFGFKNFDALVATDNGVFRSQDFGKTWILPNNIYDFTTNVSLNTKIFYSASASGQYVWLGSNEGLARIKETGLWQGEWKLFIASLPLKANEETYCFPNPFSPRQDQLKIKYSTGGENSNVTIRVYDFGMNYVSTIIQNAPRNKSLEGTPDFWDGRDAAGNFVPNGVYFYRIEIDSQEPLLGKIMVIQ